MLIFAICVIPAVTAQALGRINQWMTVIINGIATICHQLSNKENFKYGAVLRALFHDVPESLTGDVITPVKDIINKKRSGFWSKVEDKLVNEFTAPIPEKIKNELISFSLLKDFKEDLYSVDSLVKTCDQLALILECLYEKEWGSNIEEMRKAYESYTSKLQNSEWSSVREYAHSLLIDFPK